MWHVLKLSGIDKVLNVSETKQDVPYDNWLCAKERERPSEREKQGPRPQPLITWFHLETKQRPNMEIFRATHKQFPFSSLRC